MQTSAHAEPDMFAAPAAAPAETDDLVVEIRGVLAKQAEVRNKLVGHGQALRPVLCLDMRPPGTNPLQRRLHVEQVYTEATRKHAEARAAAMTRGVHVTVRTTLADMLTVLPHVLSVAITPSE